MRRPATSFDKHRDNPKHSRVGFTLIEVLVVGAIIALLISILLPSLREARYKAKLTACQANLHDLGNSLHTYAQEHDPYFPPTPYTGSKVSIFPPGDDNLFVLWYARYAKAIESWSCPATTYRVRTPDSVIKMPSTVRAGWTHFEITTNKVKNLNDFANVAQLEDNKGFGTSYEYNPWYSWTPKGQSVPMTTNVDWFELMDPDRYGDDLKKCPYLMKTLRTVKPLPQFAFLMHEADEGGQNKLIINGPRGGKFAENNKPEPWDNHGARGWNGLFVDGHVEFISRRLLDDPVLGNRLWYRQNRHD